MKANVEFKSNLYPVKGSAETDRKYLSKIYDYGRLKRLNSTLFISSNYSFWNQMQERIIEQPPVCALCKPDPCWGRINENGQDKWACKCVKTDCKYFNSCRPNFDTAELKLFGPDVITSKAYKYGYFNANTKTYPVIYNKKICDYDSNEVPKEKKDSFVAENESPIKVINIVKAIQAINSTYSTEKEDNELCNTADIQQSEEAFTNERSKEADYIYADDDLCVTPQSEYDKKSEESAYEALEIPQNIFDSFNETDQDTIIKEPSQNCLFVDAGPGTGKTYTLIQKINYMVTEEGVDPESILVLCFTNAAVDEIKDRLRNFVSDGADRSLSNVDVRTFHSFAWWLITQANELYVEDGWKSVKMETLNYNTSLVSAIEVMTRFSEDITENWGHFFVDEVQDLTNSLAVFVLTVVKACVKNHCGVTVLGDSCQAIYDYTQANEDNSISSEQFYNNLFMALYGKAKFYKLLENKRQDSSLIEIHENLRKAILSKDLSSMKAEAAKITDAVETIEKESKKLQQSDFDKLSENGNVCFLFRNNGETLQFSSELRRKGISHQVNINEVPRNFSPWIYDVIGTYDKPKIREDDFIERFEKIVEQNQYSGKIVWERLQQLLKTDNDVLYLEDIREGIYNSKIDDPIFRTHEQSNIVVSNIHRAKGREYENVVVEKSFCNSLAKNESNIGEYKTLYVALTRPKKSIKSLVTKSNSQIYPIEIFATKRRRWGKIKDKTLTHFEFNDIIDLDINSFAGIPSDYFDDISVGDSLVLDRHILNGIAKYEIRHEDTDFTLGYITDCFATDIRKRMGIEKAIDMPSTVSNLYVSGIYTQVVDAKYLSDHPEIAKICPNGIWKWIDVIGLGHLSYDVY